jgi:hypothetical protein
MNSRPYPRWKIAEKMVKKKTRRQRVMHFSYLRVDDNNRQEDLPFVNVVDGEQHSVGPTQLQCRSIPVDI